MVNPNLVQELTTKKCRLNVCLSYLFCVYHQLKPPVTLSDHEQVVLATIVNRDYSADGDKFVFKTPFYVIPEPTEIISGGEVEMWFNKVWEPLWPDTIMTNGHPIKSLPSSKVRNKMIKFVAKFNSNVGIAPGTKVPNKLDIIIDATKLYLYEQESKDWAFTMKNTNFIMHKEKGSLLATFCKRVMGGAKPLRHNFSRQL